ncbi:F-box protein At5g07610-like [Papaver somniferum]|uniref:F-box protein At5g07610-like n=1 Tax=Papaver somniferum TaxID=3469 RepID=UPI000E700A5E|nr:F-box protein At5g07610-like [Papaver somniferum]
MSSSTEQRRGGKERKGKMFDDILTRILDGLHSFKVKMYFLTKLRKGGTHRNNSSSASFIGSNIDILTLILTRIPSKPLLDFKFVSKQWCSIITDPQFVHKHFTQNLRFSIPVLLWGDDTLPSTFEYISLHGNTNSYVPFRTRSFTEYIHGIEIVQSCNGLLICKSYSLSLRDFTYYIFNPSTNKSKILPQSQLLRSNHRFIDSVSLAFDPFRSPYYKVVAIWTDRSTSCYNYKIEIYDSETSSWEFSGFYSCTLQPESIPRRKSGIFWNGSLHWCHREGSMVYFNIDRELVGVIPMPHPAREYDATMTFNIAEYRGHFYRTEINREFGRRFSIFEMDAANSSWKLKGQVDVSLNPYNSSIFLPYSDSILFIIERDEDKESTKVMLLTKESMVVSYDFKDMRFEKIHDLSTYTNFRHNVKFHQYIESLACV